MVGYAITPRQRQLVNRVIDEYIRTAEPVSSKAIAASGYFDVQSATIRNEMADLEEAGYLEQLHTSGGRVPTPKAYRLYVNDLVGIEGVTLPLVARRKMDEALDEADLREPEDVNKVLARTIGQLSGSLVMASMGERPDAYKVGLSNLLSFPEFREMDRLMGLTDFFDHFEAMFVTMHRRAWADDPRAEVRVLIGTENSDERIKDESLIVARYRLPGGHDGTLTLVGPMRMDYRKNIGLMAYAVQIANKLST